MDNSSLELYHGRLDKRPNSITLRIRHAVLRCAVLLCRSALRHLRVRHAALRIVRLRCFCGCALLCTAECCNTSTRKERTSALCARAALRLRNSLCGHMLSRTAVYITNGPVHLVQVAGA